MQISTEKALVSGINGIKGMPDTRKFRVLEGDYTKISEGVKSMPKLTH